MAEVDAQWATWRVDRESDLRRPHGWLAITAIHWLTGEPQRFDDVPGEWTGREGGALVVLGGEEVVSVGERRLGAGGHELGPLDEVGMMLAFGDAVAQVADRGGTTIVRPRHPDGPNLRSYVETPCYPPDPRWVVPGRFEGASGADGDAGDELAGDVVVELGGSERRLAAWRVEGGALWVVLRDDTSGVTTYPAGRQLVLPPPAADGRVIVDFNRVYNLPCAYTDFATCPVPPPGNTLPYPIEAGEKVPTFAR